MIQKLNISEIELIVYDCDGVLTDDKVTLSEGGKESLTFSKADGFAMMMIKKRGIPQLILSSEGNGVVTLRAKKLGIHCIRRVKNKKNVLQEYCKEGGINLKRVIYIGNDLNDFEAMDMVGIAACPCDAFWKLKIISKIILQKKGGDGVVRELLNYLEGI